MAPQSKKHPMNFKHMPQIDVPQGRNGKHKQIVMKILADLDQAQEGVALQVPLAQLTESKERVRSALNRATRKSDRRVATASDETFLYVWNETS
jgi:hypothetical protein